MSHKNKAFYQGNTEVSVDFSAEEISSEGVIVLLEKIEREHKLLDYFSSSIPNKREPLLTTHTVDPTYGNQQMSMFTWILWPIYV